jgi:hypothetical protein
VDPEYYLDTEFAMMKIIKEHLVGRYGFIFHMKGVTHELKFKINKKKQEME